jgi:hypothetical protein
VITEPFTGAAEATEIPSAVAAARAIMVVRNMGIISFIFGREQASGVSQARLYAAAGELDLSPEFMSHSSS